MDGSPSEDPLIEPRLLALLKLVSPLYAICPFAPAWATLVKLALGDGYVIEAGPTGATVVVFPRNLALLWGLLEEGLAGVARRLQRGVVGTAEELELYRGAALVGLWAEFAPDLQRMIDEDLVEASFWDRFLDRYRFLFGSLSLPVPKPGHLLAFYYQAWRAWYFCAKYVLGWSPSAVRARRDIWHANMAVDICVYATHLYRQMDDVPVLITGPTGSGKELAARCIAWARYIPFDPETRRFARRYHEDFHVRNLCAVPAELVESELFGHVKGSFTGATADKKGLFGLSRIHGTLFFDEIGELSLLLQAKLLRPFQGREYMPVGGHDQRILLGRLIFATNRDLEAECAAGTFRLDLFERMNGIRIQMPSLRTMLKEMPRELHRYVRAFVGEKLDDPVQVEALAERVVATIRPELPWDGNLRELKRYTERVLLGGGVASAPEPESVPLSAPLSAPVAAGQSETQSRPKKTSRPPPGSAAAPMSMCAPSSGILGPEAKAGRVSADAAIKALVAWVHVHNGENVAQTARITKLDRRTVTRLLDPERVARLRKRRLKR